MAVRLQVKVGEHEQVTALHYPAEEPRAGVTLLFGHGAGADQYHAFMVELATALAARGLDVVTFNFIYTEEKRGTPDRAPKLEACYRAAIECARTHAPLAGNTLVIGGKSMGGRIGSQVAPDDPAIDGLVFVGYPLHPPKQPEKLRIAHLPAIARPMLFVQGERDPFGTPAELAPILDGLRPRPDVHVVAWGDHSLKVPKKAGVSQAEVYRAVYDRIADWTRLLARHHEGGLPG